MLRLAGFFALVLGLTILLGKLPVIGPVFARTGCLGVWLTAMALSWAITKYGQRAYRMRRDHVQIRRLSAVSSPHNHGKLGALLLAQGRRRKALPHLRAAVEGEPEVAEWWYRLGCALLGAREPEEAAEAFARCVAIDEEHSYGTAQKRLAEARMALGQADEALEALATFERNHGPSPESAYRRGLALKAAGRKEMARQAFADVPKLASEAARYQRHQAGLWTLRARLASLF